MTRTLKFVLLLAIPFQLKAQNFTNVTKALLTGVGNSSSLSFDADKDGYADVLTMGKSGTGYYTKLYHNNGDSTFLDLGIPFPGLAYGSAANIDYNNDGLQDILLCGFNGIQKQFCLFKNRGNNVFTEISTSIPGVDYGTVRSSDINNDGWPDIIIAGQTATTKICDIYQNNGNGTFSKACSLSGIFDGSIAVTDINHDSYPDIIITGVDNSGNCISKIYINQEKGFTFLERTSNITPTRGGSITTFDFNADGWADILITGKKADDTYITEVYKSNQGQSFTLYAQLTGLYYSCSLTADFNNDGYPDIILAGLNDASVYQAIFYQNTSGTGFSPQTTILPDAAKGSMQVTDLTGDSKPDVLFNGYTITNPITKIFNNGTTSSNNAPAAPYNLFSKTSEDTVVLSWNRPVDNETTKKALTFDFYLKAASNGDTLFTVPADYTNGTRYVYQHGQLQDTFVVLKNLPYGKYDWSVQAIDEGYKGSSFASQKSFNICFNLHVGKDTSVCKGSSIALSAGDPTDTVYWYSSQAPSAYFHKGNNINVEVSDNKKIWIKLIKPIGCMLSDTFHLMPLPLPETGMRDTGSCINTTVQFALKKSNYFGNWKSTAGSISATHAQSVNFTAQHNDIISVIITDTNGCVNYDTATLTAYQLPQSFLPADTAQCLHRTIKLSTHNTTDTVYWYNNKGIFLAKKSEMDYPAEIPTHFYVKIINQQKCVNFDTVNVNIHPLPIANAGRDTIICEGELAMLGINYANNPGYKFEWTPSQTLSNNAISNPVASPSITSSYILKITDNNRCENNDSVRVTINPVGNISAGNNQNVCIGETVIIGGSPTAKGSLLPYTYQWRPVKGLNDPTLANPTATPDTTTNYLLTVYSGGCNAGTVNVKVNVLSLPVITKADDIAIGYHQSTQIWATGGTIYQWEPSAGLDNSIIANPTASPETTTTYSVQVTDSSGCKSAANITITIKNELFVPNLFTPNNDGKNDYFKIYGMGIDKIHLSIYSAEGRLVYETTSVEEATNNGWNGTYKGHPLDAGKYLWVIDAVSTDGKSMLYNNSNKGIVTLLK